MVILLRDAAYHDVAASALIEEVQQEYVVRYGGRDETPVAAGDFAPPTGAFLIVTVDGAPVGCGGLRRHSDSAAEIKRMYVRVDHRSRGHGRRLLDGLERRARDLGYQRTMLETGTAQPEAIGLYVAAGYTSIPPYGHHHRSPQVRCFAKDL